MAPLPGVSIFALVLVPPIGTGMAPLPAAPPIGGIGWTVIIPAILFLGSFLGTYLLYKKFSGEEEK